MVGNLSKQHEGCTTNNVKNAHGYTFSGSCTFPHGGTMVMNGTLTIQDAEHIVAESHSTTTTNGHGGRRTSAFGPPNVATSTTR
jgi:hypothetical protein